MVSRDLASGVEPAVCVLEFFVAGDFEPSAELSSAVLMIEGSVEEPSTGREVLLTGFVTRREGRFFRTGVCETTDETEKAAIKKNKNSLSPVRIVIDPPINKPAGLKNRAQ